MLHFSTDLILKAAELFGFRQPPVFFARSHQHSSGCLYETEQHILKIILSSTQTDLRAAEERLQFSRYLSSNGILCQVFIVSMNDKFVELISYQDDVYLISAWQKIPATAREDLHPCELREFYQNWAILLAQTHRLSPQYHRKTPLHWHSEWHSCHDSLRDNDVRTVFRALKSKLDSRKTSPVNFGIIHNDAHPKNILESANGLYLIDFDRCCAHFFAQDIANAIYSEFSRINFHSNHSATSAEMVENFLKPFLRAYLQAYPLPADDLRDLEDFLLYRQIIMFSIFYREIEAAAPEYLATFRENILSRKPFLEMDIAELYKKILDV